MTFNSKVEPRPEAAKAMVASLPMTWAATWSAISLMTGLTLPGIMEEPGWVAGMEISPMPHLGPLASQRMSLAILVREMAMVLSWPDASTTPSLAAWDSKWFLASMKPMPVLWLMAAMARAAYAGWELIPVPT